MKGLLLKDLYSLKKQGKVFAAMLILYILYAVLYKNVSMLSIMTALLCFMVPFTTMALDERCNWDMYALSMPVERKTIVFSKYIFGISMNIVSMIILMPVSLLIESSWKETGMPIAMFSILITTEVSIAVLSIILPILFKFGVEKGRLIMLLVIFSPTIVVFFLAKLNFKAPGRQFINMLEYLSPIAVLGILAISVPLSLRIFEKKEF